jgi:hypothetical protein
LFFTHLPSPQEYLPSIFDEARVDRVLDIGQAEARREMRIDVSLRNSRWR